jgi:hypothetical protein
MMTPTAVNKLFNDIARESNRAAVISSDMQKCCHRIRIICEKPKAYDEASLTPEQKDHLLVMAGMSAHTVSG